MKATREVTVITRLIFFSFIALALPCHAATTRDWYTLSSNEQRIGYAYIERSTDGARRTQREVSVITATELRGTKRIERSVEVERDAAGQAREVRVKSTTGVSREQWLARFDAVKAQIRIERSGAAAAEFPLQEALVLPDTLIESLAPLWRQRAAVGSQIELRYLSPSSARPVMITATVVDPTDDTTLTHIQITTAATMETANYGIDATGRLQRLTRPFYGSTLVWQPCERDCDTTVEQPFDLMSRLIVRSPFHIPKRAFKGPLRYVIRRTDNVAPSLVATAEQAVVTARGRSIITVCKECGARAPASADTAAYLRPNPWVQSDDPKIVSFARRSGGFRGTPRVRMQRLTEAVRKYIDGEVTYLGYNSALDTLSSRGGDCTEFAVLLTAAARAAGIPARLVVGAVYSDRFSGKKDVFSPHMWVQAWDGTRWISYDAALEGFDATHIAMGFGDGDPRTFSATHAELKFWQIDQLGLVREKPPANNSVAK